MSMQNATAFFEKAATDKSVRDRLSAASAGKKPEEMAAAATALGKSMGFDFTPAEAIRLRAGVRKSMIEKGTLKDELDELDLQAVSGGVGASVNVGGSIDLGDIFSSNW